MRYQMAPWSKSKRERRHYEKKNKYNKFFFFLLKKGFEKAGKQAHTQKLKILIICKLEQRERER